MSEAVSTQRQESNSYRWYVLSVLVVVYVFNFIDRSILGILLEPIKQELGASDTAMGFLGGIAFAALRLSRFRTMFRSIRYRAIRDGLSLQPDRLKIRSHIMTIPRIRFACDAVLETSVRLPPPPSTVHSQYFGRYWFRIR